MEIYDVEITTFYGEGTSNLEVDAGLSFIPMNFAAENDCTAITTLKETYMTQLDSKISEINAKFGNAVISHLDSTPLG